MDAGIQQLLDNVSNYDPEDQLILLRSVQWQHDDVELLDITLKLPDSDEQNWQIVCHGVSKSLVENDRAIADIALLEEHPLLIPYREKTYDLFFNDRPEKAIVPLLICQLYEAHQSILGEWYDFSASINANPHRSLRVLLDFPSGILGRGPESLVRAYVDILHQHGIRSSMLSATGPWTRWRDGKYVTAEKLFLLLLGESYWIAENFSAQQFPLV